MLGIANLSPLLGAVLICWIFSVCVHEFSHALAAYLGGDRSVRERGYLDFNVFSYIHPVTSILLPVLFLALGGVPLPGGAVQIDERALRNRHWSAIISAAGPLSNFTLFVILAILVHPGTGVIDTHREPQPLWATLLGAMCVLQLMAVLFNLIPLPPLDGFGILEPYLPEDARQKARSLGWGGLFLLFFAFTSRPVSKGFVDICDRILNFAGLPFESTWRAYNYALFGAST